MAHKNKWPKRHLPIQHLSWWQLPPFRILSIVKTTGLEMNLTLIEVNHQQVSPNWHPYHWDSYYWTFRYWIWINFFTPLGKWRQNYRNRRNIFFPRPFLWLWAQPHLPSPPLNLSPVRRVLKKCGISIKE